MLKWFFFFCIAPLDIIAYSCLEGSGSYPGFSFLFFVHFWCGIWFKHKRKMFIVGVEAYESESYGIAY